MFFFNFSNVPNILSWSLAFFSSDHFTYSFSNISLKYQKYASKISLSWSSYLNSDIDMNGKSPMLFSRFSSSNNSNNCECCWSYCRCCCWNSSCYAVWCHNLEFSSLYCTFLGSSNIYGIFLFTLMIWSILCPSCLSQLLLLFIAVILPSVPLFVAATYFQLWSLATAKFWFILFFINTFSYVITLKGFFRKT